MASTPPPQACSTRPSRPCLPPLPFRHAQLLRGQCSLGLSVGSPSWRTLRYRFRSRRSGLSWPRRIPTRGCFVSRSLTRWQLRSRGIRLFLPPWPFPRPCPPTPGLSLTPLRPRLWLALPVSVLLGKAGRPGSALPPLRARVEVSALRAIRGLLLPRSLRVFAGGSHHLA